MAVRQWPIAASRSVVLEHVQRIQECYMPVECPSGWSPATTPTTPVGSSTLQSNNERYARVSYEWELADQSTPPTCGCGQTCSFNFGYGYSSDGSITVTPFGVGGGVAAGVTGYTELSVNVGPGDYEYIGYNVVLKEKTESGSVTRSGGFSSGGFWGKVLFAWKFILDGPAAIIPNVTYDAADTVAERYIQSAWKICKKPCG
jgi:hypothetical protein